MSKPDDKENGEKTKKNSHLKEKGIKKSKTKTSQDVKDKTRSKSTERRGKTSPITSLSEIRRVFHRIGPGDFEKIRMIGRGGVGRVYLVRLKGTERYFAMKVLNQKDMIDKNKVCNFVDLVT